MARNGEFSRFDTEDVKGDTFEVRSGIVIKDGPESKRAYGSDIYGVQFIVKHDDGGVQQDVSEDAEEPEHTQVYVCAVVIKEDGKSRGHVFIFIRRGMEKVREWGDE